MAEVAPTVVQKYGGSSVADVAKIHKVAEQIAATRRAGKRVVAVVSAMGKTTDQLMKLAHEVSASPDRRELDMLLTAGERISMALVAMAVRDQGFAATSLTGSQCGILTNDAPGGARIVEVRPFRVQDALDQGHVVIVAGFQGTSWRREITTLGRGGSDTTAVALAAALGAECEIYSDIDGIYSADPRTVHDARRLDQLSHDETLALARAGAKVLAADAVAYARLHGIALYARKTGSESGESVVRVDAPSLRPWVVGVAQRPNTVLIQTPMSEFNTLHAIVEHFALVPVVELAGPTCTLLLARDVADAVDPAFDQALAQIAAAVSPQSLQRGTLVSIVGPAVGREPGLTKQFAQLLSHWTTTWLAHGLTLSALLPPEHADAAVRLLHRHFIAGEVA